MSGDRLMVTHSNCSLVSEKKIIDYDLFWPIAWVIRQSCTNNVWLCDQPLVISIDCRLKRILQLQFKVFVWIFPTNRIVFSMNLGVKTAGYKKECMCLKHFNCVA